MKNPCRTCPDGNKDKKNSVKCEFCQDRINYVRALGPTWAGVPDNCTDMRRERSAPIVVPPRMVVMSSDFERANVGRDVLRNKVKGMVGVDKLAGQVMKVCSRDDCKHGGTPQPIADFDNSNKSPDGKQPMCKDCRRAYQRDRMRMKTAAQSVNQDSEDVKKKAAPSPAPKPLHKICVDCRKPHPATPEYFGRHVRNPDGLQNMCRVCMGIRQKKSYRERYAVKDPHGGNGQKNIGSTKKNPSVKNSNVITVDFSGHHDLLQYLNEQAAASFRPVDMMVLSLINDHMKTHRE